MPHPTQFCVALIVEDATYAGHWETVKVGVKLGEGVGTAVGEDVGCKLDGATVGGPTNSVGKALGFKVGEKEGKTDGAFVGIVEGKNVGFEEGCGVYWGTPGTYVALPVIVIAPPHVSIELQPSCKLYVWHPGELAVNDI